MLSKDATVSYFIIQMVSMVSRFWLILIYFIPQHTLQTLWEGQNGDRHGEMGTGDIKEIPRNGVTVPRLSVTRSPGENVKQRPPQTLGECSP